jgi:deoxyribodipyrimidine photolyase-related protein
MRTTARFRDGQATLQSVEGFIRQVIGWREFIYWQYWRQMPGLKEVNFWNAHCSLPGFFWHAKTDMNCLQIVLERALHYCYTHHFSVQRKPAPARLSIRTTVSRHRKI